MNNSKQNQLKTMVIILIVAVVLMCVITGIVIYVVHSKKTKTIDEIDYAPEPTGVQNGGYDVDTTATAQPTTKDFKQFAGDKEKSKKSKKSKKKKHSSHHSSSYDYDDDYDGGSYNDDDDYYY